MKLSISFNELWKGFLNIKQAINHFERNIVMSVVSFKFPVLIVFKCWLNSVQAKKKKSSENLIPSSHFSKPNVGWNERSTFMRTHNERKSLKELFHEKRKEFFPPNQLIWISYLMFPSQKKSFADRIDFSCILYYSRISYLFLFSLALIDETEY